MITLLKAWSIDNFISSWSLDKLIYFNYKEMNRIQSKITLLNYEFSKSKCNSIVKIFLLFIILLFLSSLFK